jgi:hypothetical protein
MFKNNRSRCLLSLSIVIGTSAILFSSNKANAMRRTVSERYDADMQRNGWRPPTINELQEAFNEVVQQRQQQTTYYTSTQPYTSNPSVIIYNPQYTTGSYQTPSKPVKTNNSDKEYDNLSEHDKLLLQKMYPEKNFTPGAPGWGWTEEKK